MHLVEEHYYTINKVFLKVLGIWPHDKSRLVFLQRVLIITFLSAAIIFQLSIFITMKYNLTLFVKTMSFVLPAIIITLKYCTFILKSKAIKMLHHYIQEDWKLMQNKLENDIMETYAHNCRSYIIFIFRCVGFLLGALLIHQFFPVILNFISPLDEPRLPKTLLKLVTVEYFITQDNYIYTRILQEIIVGFLFVSIITAIGTQLVLLAHHSFGMFKIVSYRIEHSIDNHISHMSNYESAICEKIFYAVIVHRRVIEYTNILTSTFNVPFCIFAILGVLSLSINLFRFVQATTISKNTEDIFVSFCGTFGHLIYMFIANYIGQKVIDYNKEIFKTVYDIPWYSIPVTSQKLILFLLQRSGKDVYYIMGFMFVAKIENFATLVNTALSYVAVMYSIQ